MSLNASLLKKVRSGSDASKLLCSFNETYGCFYEADEILYYFQLLLCAATEHNHSNLVKHLFANTGRFHRGSVIGCISKALFFAVRSGNQELVEIFLRSNSDLNLASKHYTLVPACGNKETDLKELYAVLSPIQYACLLDEREILKLLVAYDRDQIRLPCVFHRAVIKESCADCCHDTPLHAVAQLLSIHRFRATLRLPAIVRLILEANVDVNALYAQEVTTLDLFISAVGLLRQAKMEITVEECDMISETVHILLTAESVTSGPSYDNSMHYLCSLIIHVSSLLLSMPTMDICTNLYGLIFTLVKMFLKHGGILPNNSEFFFEVLLSDLANFVIKNHEMKDSATKETYRIVLGHTADLFHYLLLSGPDAMNLLFTDDRVNDRLHRVRNLKFTWAFAWLAGHLSAQGESQKFVRMLLDHMTTIQMNQLKVRLCKLSDVQAEHLGGRFPDCRRAALRLLEEIEVPFSLQHFSRRAIIRAMSYRCLDEGDWSSLRLPKLIVQNMKHYIG